MSASCSLVAPSRASRHGKGSVGPQRATTLALESAGSMGPEPRNADARFGKKKREPLTRFGANSVDRFPSLLPLQPLCCIKMASISKETSSIDKGTSSFNSDATDMEAAQLPVASFGGVRVQRVAELNKGEAGVQEVRSAAMVVATAGEHKTNTRGKVSENADPSALAPSPRFRRHLIPSNGTLTLQNVRLP